MFYSPFTLVSNSFRFPKIPLLILNSKKIQTRFCLEFFASFLFLFVGFYKKTINKPKIINDITCSP